MKKIFSYTYRAYRRHPLRAALLAALLSFGGYAWLFGARLAAGIVALLLVHELGHFIAARRCGLRVGVPLLVPFIGAVIDIEAEKSPAEAAAVALGGPLLGTAAAAGCFILHCWLHEVDWLILAYIGALLNLFNLIPAEPLDGGRAAQAISPALWWAGIIIIGSLAVVTMSLFIWLIFIFSLVRYLGGGELGAAQASGSERVRLLSLYLGLIFILGTMLIVLAELLRLY